jgi:hypothetical protein
MNCKRQEEKDKILSIKVHYDTISVWIFINYSRERRDRLIKKYHIQLNSDCE